ncbi:PREDICTED: probable E3 ubiquitin-protein ligase RHY1A isoform X1 [Camelina sativa]|uniref:Probable E3 ubiquitin-protein ligase RHY1A isoform X1 n=1 Tax=Camelina sativa TaxID=90675 RepID=A0ABM0XPJ1_CAMSA|nr:PREDICTED: probable E3 ubiquitin-protein ligase RHY1A isoform X1 [Camelina sativa]
MAGMLPGVECARRRRFHGGAPPIESSNTAVAATAGHVWTRRPSFSLYTTNHESHQAHVSFSERSVRSKSYGEDNDEKLDGAAKEAKQRLNERLRVPRTRQNGKDKGNKPEQVKGKPHGELLTEVVGLKKSRGRLMEWFKWRVREQQDCAICLDRFKKGEKLVHLPCAHKFHSICLLPWLDTNVYCPYCRTDIWN